MTSFQLVAPVYFGTRRLARRAQTSVRGFDTAVDMWLAVEELT